MNTNGKDEGRSAVNGTANNVYDVDNHTVHLTNFDRGVLLDAFRQGQREWWLKRAQDFERAKPVPGDYVGNATAEELSKRWRWCDGVVKACQAKAEMVMFETEVEDLLDSFREAS